jgi:preprotein translocase subunit YajC
LLTHNAWSLQPEASGGVPAGGTAAPSGGGGGPPAGCADGGSTLIMFGVMFALMYFLMLRPEQKRRREMESMLKAVRKGDKVRTTGGIRGEVVELTDSDVTLLIADKVKINVLRSHVASRIDKSAPQKDDKSESKATGG